jgi:alpha-mannosidase
LDDFPTNLKGEDAEGVLAGWSALWHPALLAAVGKMPTWRAAEFSSDSLTGKLIVVPPVVEKTFSGDLETRALNEGARIIRGLHRREEIVGALLSAVRLASEPANAATSDLRSPTSVFQPPTSDFLALGTCVLWSELLVRRMRYSSNLHEGLFQDHLLAAARAAVAGQNEETRRNLTLCCNTLVESRGRYYPVDMSLVDLTLVARTTIGPALRNELAGEQPINLILSADVLAEMAEREPASLSALREAIEGGTAAVLGGERDEAELPLLSLESILDEFRAGLAEYEKHLSRRPTVFARRRFGLTPGLPQILHNLGFRAVLHATLDDGRFPQADSSKARWEGLDNSTIEAIARVPLDASEPGSFMALAEKIGHAMDHDHVATMSFAHWPGQASPFYDDLRRVMATAPVIGKFVTLDHYFANTDTSGTYSKFTPDEYRSPYLQQDVAAGRGDPLSRWVRQAREETMTAASGALETLARLVGGILTDSPITDEDAPSRLSQSLAGFSAALPREKRGPGQSYLAVNPASYGRRVLLDVSQLPALPPVKAPIKAAEETAGAKRVVVDLPPMGFAWIGPSGGEPGKNWSGEPLAFGQTLRNEFCEVAIHPTTGGIQSIHDFRIRGNRLSQQLVFRSLVSENASADPELPGSRMVADSIEITSAGLLMGEITSRGQLLDAAGKRLAGFTQRVQVTLGSRVIGLEIELDAVEPLAADPWNSYVGCRYAWSDRAAELRRSVHLESHSTRAKRIEAPHYLELEAAEGRTALLTGGLPYHVRVGARMLDTLLAVRGETAKKFRLGIGIDVPHAWMAALDLLAPPTALAEVAAPPTPVSYGWLFSLDSKNALVTHWSPLISDDAAAARTIIGFRCRVLELEGRGGRVQLRCFRKPASAERTDFENKPCGSLVVDDDRVVLDLGAYEWIQADVRWA